MTWGRVEIFWTQESEWQEINKWTALLFRLPLGSR